jgi:EAL domain-containing protein (putative c-di-GMP-specific phosphodiesterase class I)
MGNPLAAVAVMDKLHGLGVRMSIDDFGTGYSSLSYLKKFNIYKLKIDQSFVRDIATDEDDRAIVSAIIQMAHSLGFITIAEGVETPAQRDFLQKRQCDEVQGFLYARPMEPELLEAFVKKIEGSPKLT